MYQAQDRGKLLERLKLTRVTFLIAQLILLGQVLYFGTGVIQSPGC